jgi:peptidase M28-like protein
VTRSRFLAAALAAFLAGAPAPAQAPAADSAAAERVRGHVEFLSSDLLEGRDTGTRGHEIAAAYVASEFRKLGLQPGGPQGSWYVQVPFRRARHAGAPTARLIRNGRTVELASGRDFGLRPSLTEKERSIDAGLVFVGHGISDRQVRIDEYAGLDVRGKIVVVLEGAPAGLSSDVGAHLETTKDEVAAKKGAVGIIEIGTAPEVTGRRSAVERRMRPLLDWVDSNGRPGAGGVIRADAALSSELAARLFEGAPRSLAALLSQARQRPIAGFVLPGQLQIRSRSDWQDFTSPEVVAILPGSDPALARELVVLAGHLDHLGILPEAQPGEDAIHNGAIDNAGGIATMIEAARSFVQAGTRPRRSIMFVAHTGEERGLLGASYFAANPPVPADRLVGLVNLDMPLLLYDFTDVIAFGAEHSTMGKSVDSAASSMGVKLSPDPMPEQTLFTRSDHYPFVKQGVPAIFLMTGHANGGKQAWDQFLGNVYHSVKDDVRQPINWQAGAKFAELNYRIARALAEAPERPRWYRGSYFGEAFAPAQPKAER